MNILVSQITGDPTVCSTVFLLFCLQQMGGHLHRLFGILRFDFYGIVCRNGRTPYECWNRRNGSHFNTAGMFQCTEALKMNLCHFQMPILIMHRHNKYTQLRKKWGNVPVHCGDQTHNATYIPTYLATHIHRNILVILVLMLWHREVISNRNETGLRSLLVRPVTPITNMD